MSWSDRIIVASDGAVWIRRYRSVRDDHEDEWHVYDLDGHLDAWTRMPGNLRPTDIDGDRLLGVWAEDGGIERVRIFQLNRVQP